jgi:nucleoside-diphosphate-sugar epimerase
MGVKRFIYASTSSVYGVKRDREVTEDKSLEPLTDYSKYKALSEKYILSRQSPRFTVVVLRPATVCGYSPRLRLDLTVNILTISALVKKKIIVFGGEQKRPNIHIDDMVEAYLRILECDDGQIAGKIYNVGYQNYTIRHLAEMVKATLQDPHIQIEIRPTHDNRSYHVSSGKIERELGFRAKKTVEEAILDLQRAYRDGKIPAPFTTLRYYNIKTMQNVARPGDFLRNTHE